jgi:hypothetical protein
MLSESKVWFTVTVLKAKLTCLHRFRKIQVLLKETRKERRDIVTALL